MARWAHARGRASRSESVVCLFQHARPCRFPAVCRDPAAKPAHQRKGAGRAAPLLRTKISARVDVDLSLQDELMSDELPRQDEKWLFWLTLGVAAILLGTLAVL